MLDPIEADSKGRIRFDRHYGEPVSQKEALSALTRGAIDVLVAYPTYYDGKIAIGDGMQLPANFRNWQDCWVLTVNGRVAEIMDRVYTKNARVKYLTSTPVRPTISRSPRGPRRSDLRRLQGHEDPQCRRLGLDRHQGPRGPRPS